MIHCAILEKKNQKTSYPDEWKDEHMSFIYRSGPQPALHQTSMPGASDSQTVFYNPLKYVSL